MKHPLRTAKANIANYVSAGKSDWRNWDPGYYMGSGIGQGLVNFGKDIYHGDWDSVVYKAGGASVGIAEAGVAAYAAKGVSSLAGRLSAGAEESALTNGGAGRAAKYSNGWQNGSMFDTVSKFAPDSQPYISQSGKLIYPNSITGKQVVYDMEGNYFRIQDTMLSGKRTYLDLNGNCMPNNIIVNGKQMGMPQGQYNKLSHFNNIDNDFPF